MEWIGTIIDRVECCLHLLCVSSVHRIHFCCKPATTIAHSIISLITLSRHPLLPLLPLCCACFTVCPFPSIQSTQLTNPLRFRSAMPSARRLRRLVRVAAEPSEDDADDSDEQRAESRGSSRSSSTSNGIEQPRKRRARSGDADADADSEWSCPACTLLNAHTEQRCGLCGHSRTNKGKLSSTAPRPSARSSLSPSSSASSSSSSPQLSPSPSPSPSLSPSPFASLSVPPRSAAFGVSGRLSAFLRSGAVADTDANGDGAAAEARYRAGAALGKGHEAGSAGGSGSVSGSGAAGSDDWCCVHRPQSVAELSVASRKVADVQRWLEVNTDASQQHQHHQQRQSVLLLTGPPGCGKFEMVSVWRVEWNSAVVKHRVIAASVTYD